MATITDPVDLLLDDDGDLVVGTDLEFSRGVQAVAQGVRIRLLTFLGEWFADLSIGVPYYRDILGQKFDQGRVHSAVRGAILSTPGVREITSLSASYTRSTRILTVEWEVLTEFGSAQGTTEVA